MARTFPGLLSVKMGLPEGSLRLSGSGPLRGIFLEGTTFLGDPFPSSIDHNFYEASHVKLYRLTQNVNASLHTMYTHTF